MIKVKELRYSDVFTIEPRTEDKDRLIYTNKGDWLRIAENSHAFTLFYDGQILCYGGVLLYRQGFGEAWILCSELAMKHPFVVYRKSIEILNLIIDVNKLYRVQATVRCDWKQARKYLEHLGFKKEGRLKKYGPDQSDYYMYSRVK